MNKHVIAYDIGGTKIKSGLIAPSGEIADQINVPTRALEGPAGIMAAAEHATRSILERNDAGRLAGGGVSTAGVVRAEQGSIAAVVDFMPGWKGFGIKQAFESMLNQRVVVENDGNCALYAEARKQCLMDKDIALLALGTGLGGALYSNGAVRKGAFALSGHFGQTLVGALSDADGWQPLETALSGSGLANIARRISGERNPNAAAPDLFPDGHAVIAGLASSDAARAALSQWTRLLARTCHNIQWNYDPDAVIIGGGMIDSKEAWWQEFQESLADINQRFGLPCDMDVRPALLSNDAAMVGAGLMAWHELGM